MNERQDNAGFTLVEMLVATSLAAVLMSAVLAVTASLGRASAVSASQQQRQEQLRQRERLMDLLRWDLTMARSMSSSPSGGNGSVNLSLSGCGLLDGRTYLPRQRPAQVRYVIRTTGPASTPWLVREQAFEDETGKDLVTAELVCTGVSELRVERVVPRLGVSTWAEAGNSSAALPQRVTVRIKGTDPLQPVWQQEISIR